MKRAQIGIAMRLAGLMMISELAWAGWWECGNSGESVSFILGSVDDVVRCKNLGGDPQARDDTGRTPLHDAVVAADKPEIITALLNFGADPNARDDKGRTPLHFAAVRGAPKIINVLLNAGADLDARTTSSAMTPLHMATFYTTGTPHTYNHNPEAVTVLLNAGADPDATTRMGVTARKMASTRDNPAFAAAFEKHAKSREVGVQDFADGSLERQIQAALAKAGFDPGPVDGKLGPKSRSAIRAWQRANGHPETGSLTEDQLGAVLKGVAPIAASTDEDGQTAVRTQQAGVACDPWNTEIFFRRASAADVTRCLETSDPNARDDKGRTPLHAAAMVSKHPTVVAAFAKAGAELDARDEKGRTPLHLAAVLGEPEIVTALVKAGAALNVADEAGRTPMQLAERFSKTPGVVDALREATEAANASKSPASTASCEGWNTAAYFQQADMTSLSGCLETEDVNARNEHGGTPLHLAARFATSSAVVEALLEAGADPAVKDNAGKVAWDYLEENPALEGFEPQVVTEVSCEDWNTEAFFARVDASTVADCLNAGASVGARDETGATPLHVAAEHTEIPAVVTALLNAGARWSARDETGVMPLHVAAAKSTSAAVAEALLDAGADAAAKDETGKTPRDYIEVNPALAGSEVARRLAGVSCEDWNTARFFEHADTGTVSRCLRAGAEVSARDEDEATPLHFAASRSELPAVIAVLLDAGADASARDNQDKTPRDYLDENAALAGTDVARRLTGVSCEDWNTARFFEHADTAAVSRCLSEGAEVGARDEEEATPLHFAASRSEIPAVVEVLLDTGADATARDKQGRMPWDYAKTNPALKGTDVYWRLNEERFN